MREWCTDNAVPERTYGEELTEEVLYDLGTTAEPAPVTYDIASVGATPSCSNLLRK